MSLLNPPVPSRGAKPIMPLIASLVQHSERLLVRLDGSPLARRLREGRLSAVEYVGLLIQFHKYVYYTDTLLARAAERMLYLGQNPDLAHLFARKATEESGHDAWLLSDLQALGISPEVVARTPPSLPIKTYVHWNKLVIESHAPVAFLATAFILERLSLARADEAARNMVQRSGIPNIENAVLFLKGHAEADGEHVAQLVQELQQVTDPLEQEMLLTTSMVTMTAYAQLFSSRAHPVGGNAPRTA